MKAHAQATIRLLWCVVLRGSHDHERSASGRRGCVQGNGLFRDGVCSVGTKRVKLPDLSCAANPCIPE